MNTELKITKGEWTGIRIGEYGKRMKINHGVIEIWALDGVTADEANANGELIIDAGNTIQSCGLLPSQLLKQRNEMKEALKQVRSYDICCYSDSWHNLLINVIKVLESTNP